MEAELGIRRGGQLRFPVGENAQAFPPVEAARLRCRDREAQIELEMPGLGALQLSVEPSERRP